MPGVVMDEEPEENSSGEERKEEGDNGQEQGRGKNEAEVRRAEGEEVEEAMFDTKISTLVPIECLIKTSKWTWKSSESDQEKLEAPLFTSKSNPALLFFVHSFCV